MSLAAERWRQMRVDFHVDLAKMGLRVRPVPGDLLERGRDVVWPLKPVPKADRPRSLFAGGTPTWGCG